MSSEPPVLPHEEPMHEWFGLSYSSYLVLQRSVIQAMPVEWQHRMVALLEEVEARFDTSHCPPRFSVHARDERGRFVLDPFRDYRRGAPPPLRAEVSA